MRSEVEIIAALAHACGLEWAMCVSENCDQTSRCSLVRGHGGSWHMGDPEEDEPPLWMGDIQPLPPTLEDWAAEWAAEHPGEPGPVREWTSEDGRVHWATTDACFVTITVGGLQAVRWMEVPGWAFGRDDDCESADVAELARLMQAADGGA